MKKKNKVIGNKKPRIYLASLLFLLLVFSCNGFLMPKTQSEGRTGKAALVNLQSSFREISKDVIPVVVNVNVTDIVSQETPWDYFFNDPEEEDGTPREKDFEQFGMGSGVIVDRIENKYYVLTNYHVVKGSKGLSVTLHNKKEYNAKIIGEDERKDISLLVFEAAEDLPVAVLGDSDKIEVGDWVLAIGNPFGWQSSVTAGIVSALGRRLDYNSRLYNISDFIQTDAGINPGNSGGALVNLDGEVVGINTWITSPTGGSIGIGFAIPINNAKKAIKDFIKIGKVQYGWLGVSISRVPINETAKELEIEGKTGAFISQIIKDSPADHGGLLPGDLITKINEVIIRDDRHLTMIISDILPNIPVKFEIIRLGKTMVLTFPLEIRPMERLVSNQTKKSWPGLEVLSLSDKLRKKYKFPDSVQGIMVNAVERGTAAFYAGFQNEDVIIKINGVAIKTMMDYFRNLNDKKVKELEITVLRNESEEVITLSR
jgi:serine protease Do